MPKRRDLVRMTDDELWQFIESQKTVQFATIQKDGTPHLIPLWFAVHDGGIAIETFTKSQKVKNLERDPRVTLLFEDGLEYPKLRGAQIRGVAELVHEDEAVHELSLKVLVRNAPGAPVEALEKVSRSQAPKKTAVIVRPGKIMTWDHTKLDGIY